MHLDSLTLMVPDAFATALACLFLFGAWRQFRCGPALLWWAAANGINAISLAVLTAGLALHMSLLVMAGVGLMTIVPALIWDGVRRFNNRSTPLALLAAGLVVWLATGLIPFDIDHHKWSTLAGFAIWCAYLSAAVWSLWSTREEKLNARWPLMALLAVHATTFFGGGYEIFSGTFQLNEPPILNSWFGAYHFDSILYSMGTAIFMVLMCKERIELGYINAAKVDALTGAANHGAWFESARRLLNRCQQEGSPFSLIMFDLDHFKAVNDIHGHLAGNRVLQAFADTVRGALRPNDLFGRYGGEEFIVVLPGATIETARVIANRARRAFADTHRFVDGQLINATVSAGVASASHGMTLEAIIEAADKAMYAAKKAGRNCVKRADDDRPADGDKIIRVA
jgi:diguanylate cyclase (GGDEF)-like protein